MGSPNSGLIFLLEGVNRDGIRIPLAVAADDAQLRQWYTDRYHKVTPQYWTPSPVILRIDLLPPATEGEN